MHFEFINNIFFRCLPWFDSNKSLLFDSFFYSLTTKTKQNQKELDIKQMKLSNATQKRYDQLFKCLTWTQNRYILLKLHACYIPDSSWYR